MLIDHKCRTKEASYKDTRRRTTYSRKDRSPKRAARRADLWIAMVDFQKACDAIEHSWIWRAFRRQSVGEPCIKLLKKTYDGLTAAILFDVESERFKISRRTKLGAPIELFAVQLAVQLGFTVCDGRRHGGLEAERFRLRR